MLGRIDSIENNIVKVKLEVNIYDMDSIINKNIVFKGNNKIIGEITDIKDNLLYVSIIGEIIDNKFIFGDINKPSFKDDIYLITKEELDLIFTSYTRGEKIILGSSYIYPEYQIKLDLSNFFSNHFAILGNSGSGKSYSVAHIIQSLFKEANDLPYRANLFIFDAYGEYQNAFSHIGDNSVNINYKVYTTDLEQNEHELLHLPFWLLSVDDIALLLDVNDKRQIPIIEKALKLVGLFSKKEEEIIEYKNDILARSLLDIIFNGKSAVEIRTRLLSILTKFNTSTLNLDTMLVEPGWSRSLRQCLYIDKDGKIANIELVTSFFQKFVKDELDLNLPNGSYRYTIEEYYLALEFALISEGIYNSDSVFDYANILKIRLNYLINSSYSRYFAYPNYISKNNFIKLLLTTNDNKKAQVINFNINYVDDRFAKKIVKIYSKLLFDYATSLKQRAKLPFHIVLEEAHRYVQNDNDIDILGYNIFERITKEGRKYGVLLGVISQRPSELSETVLSQSSNFLIFKMFYPKDLSFVSEIVPSLGNTLSSKLKTLYPGVCVAFGTAFKMPILIKMDKPNPEPSSSSTDILSSWYLTKS